MKGFTGAVAVVALIAMRGSAQVQGKRNQGDQQKKEEKKPEVDEKAYKAALERIPEPKEKYDPWGVARPAEPARKPKRPRPSDRKPTRQNGRCRRGSHRRRD